MSGAGAFKRRMHAAKQTIRRAVSEARASARAGGRRAVDDVNVADRANVVVTKNVGSHGAVQGVSSSQKARIRQDGQGTHEETETTTVERRDH